MHISSHRRHNRWGDEQLVALILSLDANKPLKRWRNKNRASQMSAEWKFGVNMTSEQSSTQIWNLLLFFVVFPLVMSCLLCMLRCLFQLHFVKLYFYPFFHLTEHKNVFAMSQIHGGFFLRFREFSHAQTESSHKNCFLGGWGCTWHAVTCWIRSTKLIVKQL